MANLFCPKDAQCPEAYAKTNFRFFLTLLFHPIFILNFWELEFREPDLEMVIADNQLARGIQFKSVRGLWSLWSIAEHCGA